MCCNIFDPALQRTYDSTVRPLGKLATYDYARITAEMVVPFRVELLLRHVMHPARVASLEAFGLLSY